MEKYRIPLDTYDMKPKGMLAYLRYNGWHFNKGLCEWAIRQRRSMNKTTAKLERIDPIEKDTVMELLKANSITLDTTNIYDAVYVANMAKADFYKSSLKDEASLAMYIKDVVEDPDQEDGFIFNRFYADCMHNGVGIPWEDVL